MEKTSNLGPCSLFDQTLKAALVDFSEAYFCVWWSTRNLADWRRTDLETICRSLMYARDELDSTIRELMEAVDKVEPWTNAHMKN